MTKNKNNFKKRIKCSLKNLVIGLSGMMVSSVAGSEFEASKLMEAITQIVIACVTIYTMYKNSKKQN